MARTTPSLQQALDEYLGTRLHLAANTQLNDRSVLAGFVRTLSPIQVGNLTAQHVEHYFLGVDGVYHRLNPAS